LNPFCLGLHVGVQHTDLMLVIISCDYRWSGSAVDDHRRVEDGMFRDWRCVCFLHHLTFTFHIHRNPLPKSMRTGQWTSACGATGLQGHQEGAAETGEVEPAYDEDLHPKTKRATSTLQH